MHAGGFWKVEALAVGITLGAVLTTGKLDYSSAKVTAAHVREADERKADVQPRDRLALSYPIGCGQIFAKRGAGEHWKVYSVCTDFRGQP